jgi:hypothetical protein
MEDQYYFLYPEFTPGMVILQPDEATSRRHYLSAALPPGKPLRFLNGFADRVAEAGGLERIDDLLYQSKTFAFRDHLREKIEAFDIADLQFYPMVFTDSKGVDHRDYWFANVYDERPFLDEGKSDLMPGQDTSDEDLIVVRYAFNRLAMSKVAEEQRLIFRLARAGNCGLVFHQRIADILAAENATGYRAFRVSEFTEGEQY